MTKNKRKTKRRNTEKPRQNTDNFFLTSHSRDPKKDFLYLQEHSVEEYDAKEFMNILAQSLAWAEEKGRIRQYAVMGTCEDFVVWIDADGLECEMMRATTSEGKTTFSVYGVKRQIELNDEKRPRKYSPTAEACVLMEELSEREKNDDVKQKEEKNHKRK